MITTLVLMCAGDKDDKGDKLDIPGLVCVFCLYHVPSHRTSSAHLICSGVFTSATNDLANLILEPFTNDPLIPPQLNSVPGSKSVPNSNAMAARVRFSCRAREAKCRPWRHASSLVKTRQDARVSLTTKPDGAATSARLALTRNLARRRLCCSDGVWTLRSQISQLVRIDKWL